jgi:hypothetical protein
MNRQPSLQPIIVNFKTATAAQRYVLAQKLGTSKGFYETYFKMLPVFKTAVGPQKKCFDLLNELHHKIFNEYRYSDYNSFRKALAYHHKTNRK